MTAVTWSDSFATVDTNIWKNSYGVLPTALGGGKIKFQRVAGNSCFMSRVPFGAEGSLEARSIAMSFTVYPGESSAYWKLAAGNQQGTWPHFEPHENTAGFSFIDGTQRMYGGNVSGFNAYGDIQAPATPYEIRVSAYLVPGSNLVYTAMSVDGVLVADDYVQSTGAILWDPVLGYQLPYFNLDVSDDIKHVVVGGLSGIYGGSRAENLAFVKAGNPASSTLAPVFSLSGALATLDTTADLPILYSRNLADIPSNFIPYGTAVEDLSASLYTAPFPVVEGETIYAATVAGNGLLESYAGGFRVGAPVAYTVDIPNPEPPTIYPPTGSYTGTQFVGIVSQTGAIRFTTDGTDPTASSEIFTRGFRLTDGMTVKAVADLDGILSAVSEATYSIQGDKIQAIPSYTAHVLPYLLEQYKGDNP